jgi:pyrimidine operon attenuation protein/uracil phosphoribosyltransferase
MLMTQNKIIDEEGIERILRRIAHEISERNQGTRNLALVGIPTGGVHLAHRLSRIIKEMEGNQVETGELDTTLYRDDLPLKGPIYRLKRTDIPFDLNGRRVILIDDVLQTGRTIRAALDAITDLGRPRNIQLAVLIDRGGRELPIQADYTGKLVTPTGNEEIEVRLRESDGADEVIVRDKKPNENNS